MAFFNFYPKEIEIGITSISRAKYPQVPVLDADAEPYSWSSPWKPSTPDGQAAEKTVVYASAAASTYPKSSRALRAVIPRRY